MAASSAGSGGDDDDDKAFVMDAPITRQVLVAVFVAETVLSVCSVATAEQRWGMAYHTKVSILDTPMSTVLIGGFPVTTELQLFAAFMTLTAAAAAHCQVCVEVGGRWFSKIILALGGKPFFFCCHRFVIQKIFRNPKGAKSSVCMVSKGKPFNNPLVGKHDSPPRPPCERAKKAHARTLRSSKMASLLRSVALACRRSGVHARSGAI